MAPYVPTYHQLDVKPDGSSTIGINYVEAGDTNLPTVLLLHGFPSDISQFRDLIPMLSNDYHVLAPDLPGFGLTTYPEDFVFTFDNLARAIRAWLTALKINSYAMYIFDYGAPVGLRLALEKPDEVKSIIAQNGNAYDAGFGHPFWDPIEVLWASENGQAARDQLRSTVLTLEITNYQYTAGVPDDDKSLINMDQPRTDYLANIAGKKNQENQLDLFYDYRTNKAMYPKFHEYFRKSQVPLLAVWGKGDPAFIPPGAEAYKKDLPNAEVHFVDSGHFALETKRWEIAAVMLNFWKKIGSW